MATHSSVLAWRIPGTGEPVGLPSMGSHRVGHDSSDLSAAEPFGQKLSIRIEKEKVCVAQLYSGDETYVSVKNQCEKLLWQGYQRSTCQGGK